eukprot:CAMPEP_0202964850 /NCGR_PEP_ID=MMETSP1396-20130829/8955_1 /ASSEMBLY_ACC=CAM_ASM_000872 /TAXON_ID= /ORGANISM="Pseudokeronopsis sp., Strain Brazil" /LENGTH=121 /DNA_ID=CAMNT_0049687287 /DNA_START=53 /DNA_END=418 /DNA_ORIENTATION=-
MLYRQKKQQVKSHTTGDQDAGSENETDEDNEEDYIDVLPVAAIQDKKKGPRTSVSAEAFGLWNTKGKFQAREVPKPPETAQKILARLRQSFLFAALSEQELQIVVGAMEERKASAGSTIIS